MMRLALVLLVVAGCDADDHDTFAVEPNDTDTTVPPPGNHNPGTLSGRICISNTLANLSQCRTTNLGGFTVSIGGESTTTDSSGNFTLPTPTGSLLSFTVSGPGAVTTTTPFSPSLTLPVIDADVYARALMSNQIFAVEGQGAIMGSVVRDGVPASGISVSSTPTGAFSPVFDLTGETVGATSTGARGVFWVPGIASNSAALRFTDSTGAETTVAGISVVNGGVTILDSVPL